MLSRVVRPVRRFSQNLDITIVDTSSLLKGGKPNLQECKKAVEGFYKHGVIAIRDPRVDESKNQEFLNLMTRYFEDQSKLFYSGQQLPDCRPETSYQVGVTPEKVEQAREHKEAIEKYFSKNRVSLNSHLACYSSATAKRRKVEVLLANRKF